MQKHDCKAAFLSKGEINDSPGSQEGQPAGSASSLRATDRMEKHSWQRLARVTGHTFSLSLQYEPRLHHQRWRNPGQTFQQILLP